MSGRRDPAAGWLASKPRTFANVIGIRGRRLGGARLTQRLGKLADSLRDPPGEGFPKALVDAQLEAAYRFFGND